MIKKMNLGFSLAELLIALFIVSVIATIGFTLSKKGIERAYDAYFYTGYKGMYDAIAETNNRGFYIEEDFSKFASSVAELMGTTGTSFTASNNITYTLTQVTDGCRITMQVPTVKRNGVSKIKVYLYYLPKSCPFLIPKSADTNTIADFETRKDLLAFTIDDGLIGRTVLGKTYKPVKDFYSAREAICKVYGANAYLSCSGIAKQNNIGVLKLINPRKI